MRRPHPNPQASLEISLELYNQLNAASLDSGYTREIWEIAAAALHDWLARHAPNTFPPPENAGYQWKELFLPNGTLLRTSFAGEQFHCIVERNHLRYKETRVSPSGFANSVGGTRRNAWTCIWLLFPNTSCWRLASTLRSAA